MLTLAGTFKSIFGGWATASRSARHRVQSVEHAQSAPAATATATATDEEQHFLASIARLPVEEREQRTARLDWFRQLAERQALIEAEHTAERDWWK